MRRHGAVSGVLALGLAAVMPAGATTDVIVGEVDPAAGSNAGQAYNVGYRELCAFPPPVPVTPEDPVSFALLCFSLVQFEFLGGNAADFPGNQAISSGGSQLGRGLSRPAAPGRPGEDPDETRVAASADIGSGTIGFFATVQGIDGERDETFLELASDDDGIGFLAGVDYAFDFPLLVGVAAGVSDIDSDYTGGSTLESDATTYLAYFNYQATDLVSLGGSIGFTSTDYELNRLASLGASGAGTGAVLSGPVRAEFDGKQQFVNLNGALTNAWGNASASAFFAADYVRTRNDGYQESGGTNLELIYPELTRYSLTTTVGGWGAYTFNMPWGSISPRVEARYVHEFRDDALTIDTRFAIAPTAIVRLRTDDPDRDFAYVNGGLVVAFDSGLTAFARYETLLSHDFLESNVVSGGLLFSF